LSIKFATTFVESHKKTIFQYWMIKIQCAENSNDIYYHLVHTVESQFFEPPREIRIGLKDRVVWEIRGKINVGLG